MISLQFGKSYLYLFPVYGVLLLAAGVASVVADGTPAWGALVMPACLAYMVACEVRSGVTLDSWWRAAHPEGTLEYRAKIAWHVIGAIVLLVFATAMIEGRVR